ncbi:MAG: CAP domain-containing protein [Eubacteriales bacterium]|nr:CAP domain-containing protein [Eubacteriales bacterium]MDD3199694.1 CAP domain-containing protein [Eubacteriales bacterium]MDD4122629.1 CAP domain-containing protein [Eubacteriales bacterium]MDD4629096.1 CAP domain-containing protein [Eubacteriales bacterium]
MKRRFVKITLILSTLLVMALPAQAFAAEKNCSLNQSRVKYSNCGNIYKQVSPDTIKQFQQQISLFCQNKIDRTQFQNLVKEKCQKEAPIKVKAPAVPAKPAAPATPAKPAVPAVPVKPAAPSQEPAPSASMGAYEQQVVDMVNKERAAAGLPALKVNTKLAGVAEKKAEDLRDKNYFSHTSPTYGSPFDMMKQFGISYSSAGENIAKGQKTPDSVMNGWMNSPGHKANILNTSFSEIGVGYVTDSNGTTYWVQMFIRP